MKSCVLTTDTTNYINFDQKGMMCLPAAARDRRGTVTATYARGKTIRLFLLLLLEADVIEQRCTRKCSRAQFVLLLILKSKVACAWVRLLGI